MARISQALAGSAAAAALLVLTAAPSGGGTGYAHLPFRDQAVAVAQAAALERLTARARAVQAIDEAEDELMEQATKMRSRDLPLFRVTLGQAAPDVAQTLLASVDMLLAAPLEAAADGAAPVLEAAEAARTALFGATYEQDPAFRAAVMASLLLANDGVAEAYEDAAEDEVWEYPAGWGALQLVGEHWAALRPLATEEAAFEIDEMLAALDELLPDAHPPERFASDPEEPEAYAHRLVGFLETVADAELYPGRDLGRVADTVLTIAGEGCEAQGEEEAQGPERLAIARYYYTEALRRPLSVLAAEAHETATSAFDALLGRSEELPAEDACAELLSALTVAHERLAPPAPR